MSSDHFLLQLWIDQKDHETLDLDSFMPFGITLLWSWISFTTRKDRNGNGQQLYSKVSYNPSLDYALTSFVKYFKYTTSGGMTPNNWIWVEEAPPTLQLPSSSPQSGPSTTEDFTASTCIFTVAILIVSIHFIYLSLSFCANKNKYLTI